MSNAVPKTYPPVEGEKVLTAVGTYKLEDAELLQRINLWYKTCVTHERESRKQMEEDHAFVAGHQWAQSNLDEFRANKKPALTLNHCLPSVNALCGEERLNRQDIKYYGREESDNEAAHAFSEVVRWISDECDGDYEKSAAFRDSGTGGLGWLEVYVDYIEDPEGQVGYRQVPWDELYKDPLCRKPNLKDCRFLVREKWLPFDDIDAEWPEKSDALMGQKDDMLSASGAGMATETTPRGDGFKGDGDQPYRPTEDTWRVLEVHWWELVDGAIALNPETEQMEELTKRELDVLLAEQKKDKADFTRALSQATVDPLSGEMVPSSPQDEMILNGGEPKELQYVERKVKCYYHAFACGQVLLEKNKNRVRAKMFKYIPVCGVWDEEDDCWYGIIRNLKDPQRMYNVGSSTVLSWVQRAPQNGWIGPKGSFADKDKWHNRSSHPGFIGEYNRRGGDKPEMIRPPALPRHMIDLPAVNLEAIRQIGGVNWEMQGQGQRQEAGVVLELRRKQAMTVIQTYFDNLRLANRLLGRLLAAYTQEYISDNRKVRILGPSGPKYVVAMRDFKFMKFDAVVEDSNDSATDQLATMYILQTALPSLVKAGIPVPPVIVDVLPIQPKIKKDWKAWIEAQSGGAPDGQGAPGTSTALPGGGGGAPQLQAS